MEKFKKLVPYIKPYYGKFFISTICMLFVAVFTALSRWLVKPVVDKIFYYKDLKLLSLIVVAIPLVYLLNGVFNYLKNYISIWIANSVVRKLRYDLFHHLQNISIDYFVMKSTTGKTLTKLTNDLNNVFLMLSKVPTVLITDTISVIGLIFVLFYLSIKFALISLIALPIALLPIYIFTKKLRYYSKKIQTEITNLYNNIQESISAIFVTQIFNQQNREIKNFDEVNNKVYSAILKFARTEYLSSPIMEFIGAVGVAVVILIGGRDVILGRWTPGGFFAFLATVLSFYQPLKRIAEINPTIQQGLVSLERIFEILEQRSSVVEVKEPKIAKFEDKIIFKNVKFGYVKDNIVLDNINLQIKKGQKVAIVGPSGSGKSTILNLLLRFYDVDEGEILIDGVNIKNFSLISLRKLFGVVVQETFLFNNTIRYNITYAKEDATEEEIIKVAKMAYIYDTIMKLPQKFDTIIGERGYSLSGGERQRIAIARALLTNPQMFIFDEPTSALDVESENIFLQAIKNVVLSKTVLLITHRLNLVVDFDYIYVFSKGKIVAEGKHEELLKNKFYASLVNLQSINNR
jgi:subfamily B ATP-binding cassette protein MsbA